LYHSALLKTMQTNGSRQPGFSGIISIDAAFFVTTGPNSSQNGKNISHRRQAREERRDFDFKPLRPEPVLDLIEGAFA
jgi:hypothetical protein